MNQPNEPTNHTDNTPWEEAMSRDFDARVRDLHEAPLDFDRVKGKAHKIRRNRRAAVAGGILGVAAVITPIAVIASTGNGTHRTEPPVVNRTDQTTPPTEAADPTGIDYLQGRTWHQADGDEIDLPKGDYYQAGVWDDQLVTLQPWGEVFAKMTVFDADGGTVSETEDVAGFATSNDGKLLAYTTADGQLIAQWSGGQAVLAEDVTDSAGGESVGGAPVAVTGTAPCEPESGACLVRVNTDTGGCKAYGSSDVPLPTDGVKCFDEQDGLLTYTNEVRDDLAACGGVWSDENLRFVWHGCEFQAQDISPDGQYVLAIPSQSDGAGPLSISALDIRTGEEAGRYGIESGFINGYAWTVDNAVLFSEYDGANWHLKRMDPASGSITEIADPVKAGEFSNPWLLIRH